MPIDKLITDAMFGTFKTMVQECKDKGLSGEDFDKMVETLKRMEQLGEEMDDVNAFNATLAQEDLMNKFSQHYGAMLSSEAKKEITTKDGGYDDKKLMAQTLKAYEDSIKSIKEQEQKAFAEAKGDMMQMLRASSKVVPATQKVIDLGKSGVSYPVFLTKMIEEGLDKALEGQALLRDAIVFEIEINKDFAIPPIIGMHEERLSTFDEMAKKSLIGLPDAFEFSMKDREIQHKYQPKIDEWQGIQDRWEKILELLYDWLDSYCKFAPHDDRWRPPGVSESQIQKNIRKTKGCNPGFLKEREKILDECFGIKWDEIFKHESFKFKYKSNFFPYSEERFALLKETYQHCKPGIQPPKELIEQAEKLHDEKKCQNPNLEKGKEEMKEKYDKYWGEGAYEKTFGSSS